MKDRRYVMNLFNSEHRKVAKALRAEDTKDGYKFRSFNTFGFKALSGTKELVDTLRSRYIILIMSRDIRSLKTPTYTRNSSTLKTTNTTYHTPETSKKRTS
jgi:hypothetical protein